MISALIMNHDCLVSAVDIYTAVRPTVAHYLIRERSKFIWERIQVAGRIN